MPSLRNARHEAFCQSYFQSRNATTSYQEAFPSPKSQRCLESAGARLLSKVEVQARIVELSERTATKAVLTMQRRRELMANITDDDTAEHRDIIAAVMADAKLAGELIDKQAHTVDFVRPITIRLPGILTDVQAAAQRRKGLAQGQE